MPSVSPVSSWFHSLIQHFHWMSLVAFTIGGLQALGGEYAAAANAIIAGLTALGLWAQVKQAGSH